MIVQMGPIPTTNYALGRQGMTVQYIALHHSEASMESMNAHFHSPSAQVSAHYAVARDGRVWQWVSDLDTAYAVGNFTGNLMSISIEHEELGDDDFTDIQYATSAALIRQLCLDHGVPIQRGAWPGLAGIVKHSEFSATACPGSLDIDRLIEEAQEEDVAGFTDADKAYLDAKVVETVSSMADMLRREMVGKDPAPGYGAEPLIAAGQQINPSNGKV